LSTAQDGADVEEVVDVVVDIVRVRRTVRDALWRPKKRRQALPMPVRCCLSGEAGGAGGECGGRWRRLDRERRLGRFAVFFSEGPGGGVSCSSAMTIGARWDDWDIGEERAERGTG